MRFPAKKTVPKSKARFPAKKKKAFFTPVGLSCDSSHPPPESVRGTLTSQPKFLGSIDYQISLAMVLRWRAGARAPL